MAATPDSMVPAVVESMAVLSDEELLGAASLEPLCVVLLSILRPIASAGCAGWRRIEKLWSFESLFEFLLAMTRFLHQPGLRGVKLWDALTFSLPSRSQLATS
eukprot:6031315-Amphidinium_carterae.1